MPGARKAKVHKVRVITKEGSDTFLVRAKSGQRAQAHVVLKCIEVSEATPDDCVAFGVQGGKIEEAIE